MTKRAENIQNILHETRVFPPPSDFAARAHVKSMPEYEALYSDSRADPEAFWGEIGREFTWFKPFTKVLSWNQPDARWFEDGTTNVSTNCLDRHVANGRRNKAAIICEYEDGRVNTLTYGQLLREVCQLASALKELGIAKGDRVGIYMPNCAEAAIAMLACARIGAVHSVIFGGFSSSAIRDRMNDCEAKAIITSDGLRRRGKVIDLKEIVDAAVAEAPTVKNVIVHRNCGNQTLMLEGRDNWWHELCADQPNFIDAEACEAEHPLYLLYTSGTTGKPKGIVHSTAGYLVWVDFTTRYVFDLQEDDVYFCTADVGWVTGHSYVVYGVLSNGGTTLMYEGAPTYPAPDRFWQMIAKHGVNILYTAPTAIRTFMRLGEAYPAKHDLSSLRLLGTVGEPINPEAWIWYHRVIGGARCPIVDTWWQTETGGIMVSPLPGATPTKPGSCTLPLPGVVPAVLDEEGKACGAGQGGKLVITEPWPGMLRGIYGDRERYIETYFADGPHYLVGDAAYFDSDNYLWVLGRMDDVVNVSGHRLGTSEIESALVSHPHVAEAAVVARPDEITGQALVAFVTVNDGVDLSDHDGVRKVLGEHVAKEIGKLARPAEIRFAKALPKTRSGKIMRRLLRDIAEGKESTGDTSTLEDYTVLQQLRESED